MRLDRRGSAVVAWEPGMNHRLYEDSFRLLTQEVPLVARAHRGELFAICDGIGSAPKGRESAQAFTKGLDRFYHECHLYTADPKGVHDLLHQLNMEIHSWGFISATNLPLGGCAGTIAWYLEERLHIFHAGDTAAVFCQDGEGPVLLTRFHEIDGFLVNYFGIGPNLTIETTEVQVEAFDRLLLMSDGVTKRIPAEAAGELVMQHERIDVAATELARRARALGSTDDITVMLVEFQEEES